MALAARGFVTLRFDFDGTGDSSGGFNDAGRDQLWIESVVEATKYLRSLGLNSVSAVGMRLGATLFGVAADRHQLDLSSVVLWDPCDSGQSFLRELNALDRAVARNGFRVILLLRLDPIFLPFAPLNYALGLTGVRFRDYLLASWLGMFPASVLYVYFGSLLPHLSDLGAAALNPLASWRPWLLLTGVLVLVSAGLIVRRGARRLLHEQGLDEDSWKESGS